MDPTFAMVVMIFGWAAGLSGGGGAQGNAVNFLPGYVSEAACNKAGEMVKAKAIGNTVVLCVPHTGKS